MNKGLIHIYCGDGKGKTSAALGLAVRSAGSGYKVVIVRLMKDCNSGELNRLENIPEIRVIPAPEKLKFVFNMSEVERNQYKTRVLSMLDTAFELVKKQQVDVLIIDEACSAVSTGMLDLETLTGFLKSKPENLEVVMTGRNPSNELIETADYVSEIKKVKHPFDRKLPPRRGIEF